MNKKDTEVLITELELIVEGIKNKTWKVDSAHIHMSNDFDDSGITVSKRSIDIGLELRYSPKPALVTDDVLDIVRRGLIYPRFTPSLISPLDYKHNPYHKHSKQLEDYLESKGIKCKVSRSNVGKKWYYNLKFKIKDNDENYTDLDVEKVLDVDNVGLVSFESVGGVIYKTILVDEDELHDKYLNMLCDDLCFGE